jgi:hypothetical protein
MLLSPLKECESIGIHITGPLNNHRVLYFLDFEEFLSEKPPTIGLIERLEESESDESSDDESDNAT